MTSPLLFFYMGDVARTIFCEPGQRIERLRCPYTFQRCSSECIALTVQGDDLFCKAIKSKLGTLDPELLDLDIIDALKHGTDHKQTEAAAEPPRHIKNKDTDNW